MVGGCIYVSKKTGRKSWVYMWNKDHRRREMGLGAFPDVSLALAREKAQLARELIARDKDCLLYTSPSPRDATLSRMPSSA